MARAAIQLARYGEHRAVTPSEQAFYKSIGFLPPKRCPVCRRLRRPLYDGPTAMTQRDDERDELTGLVDALAAALERLRAALRLRAFRDRRAEPTTHGAKARALIDGPMVLQLIP